ncbi:MAG: HAMP domain-containing histidine kinase [bacterium]|nr:HAMP domain-containing histidine kinase [bacterium]MDN5835348.1 HAMP domain-containing histidine kinase [bacterium]
MFWLDDMPSVLMAAHELKSPLSLIRQLGFSLEDETMSHTDRRKAIERIILTSERSLRLTSDLTRTARLDDALFNMEPLSPDQICQQVASDMSPLSQAYGLDVYFRRRRSLPLVVANRDLLIRIVTNFVDNAIHYADKSQKIELDAKLIGREQMVRLSVRDFGPGVSKKALRKMFERSSDQTNLPTRPLSSGLGLYIVSSFAQAMNGRVGAVRHRDGVSFYVDVQASSQLSLL